MLDQELGRALGRSQATAGQRGVGFVIDSPPRESAGLTSWPDTARNDPAILV